MSSTPSQRRQISINLAPYFVAIRDEGNEHLSQGCRWGEEVVLTEEQTAYLDRFERPPRPWSQAGETLSGFAHRGLNTYLDHWKEHTASFNNVNTFDIVPNWLGLDGEVSPFNFQLSTVGKPTISDLDLTVSSDGINKKDLSTRSQSSNFPGNRKIDKPSLYAIAHLKPISPSDLQTSGSGDTQISAAPTV